VLIYEEQLEGALTLQKKNPHAQALGSLGGRARMDSLTHRERRELAAKAGAARAKKLSARKRKEIAKAAVAARERRRSERRAKG
jgi:hypothetical protein